MRKFLLTVLVSIISVLLFPPASLAVNPEDCEKEDISTDKIGECITYLSGKVSELSNQKKTLSSQISQFNKEIQLTGLKITESQATIDKLEKEIGALGARITNINVSVDKLEDLLKKRIVATYQQGFVSNLELIVAANDFSDLILRLQYLRQVQENDKRILTNLQQTKTTFANQKDEREEKQAQIEASKKKLESLKANLDSQKAEKQAFLEITKNDEKKYQQLLAQAQAEQAIVFGGGSDVFLRNVSHGDSIGSIASHGASPGCSSGAHLHFEVHKNGSVQDPNNYLKATGFSYSYGSEYYSSYGTINPHGELPWPINEPITIHQGYGSSHSYARTYPNGSHMGIDMDSGSSTVRAAKSGKLYGGSITCTGSNPGKLYYAKVEHDDGLTTWYLHMIPS